MPQALSSEKLARIRAGLEMGTDQKTIAQQVGVSKRQVTRIRHNLVFYGSIKCPKKPYQGRQPKITEGMAAVRLVLSVKFTDFRQELLEYLSQKPNAQRDEMVYFIWDTFNVAVSESCIGRLLRKRK
jgi:transposase